MPPRDTSTGSVLERLVLPALEKGGYSYQTQVNVGRRLGGGKHSIDVLAQAPPGRKILVSLKWQQVGGTAEQKVPFEVMCLTQVMLSHPHEYERAYLVLGGPGWKLREFYVTGGLKPFLAHPDVVVITDLESFLAKANTHAL